MTETQSDYTEYSFGPDQLSSQRVVDTLVSVAKVAGWSVFSLDDDTVLANTTVRTDTGSAQHTITIKPTGTELPVTRSINDEPSDATRQVETVLRWLIEPAIRSAEYRGAEGEFTD